jgi:Major Facilitator Superfamily
MSKFTRLAITHALMMGGDAAMVVALADSFFFNVELDAARTQVLLFLVVSFAPFLFVAPLVGPLIDRMAGGRRLVIQVVAVTRVVLLLLMAKYIDGLALFPLVFASLVLQKAYVVSKSALVPSTVRSENELVEANSKLGLVSGLTGAVAVVPAGILQQTVGPGAALLFGAVLFTGSFVSARRLAPEVIASSGPNRDEVHELNSPAVQRGALAMLALRANVGFTFFHLAFWLRSFDNGTALFGAAIAVSAIAAMIGNATAPRLRRVIEEETMLSLALIVSAIAGVSLAAFDAAASGIAVAGVVNLAASLGRLGFDSIVQRDAPDANQGRAFATFETRFQLAWAVAAFVAVAIQAPGPLGLLIVGLVGAATSAHLQIRQRSTVGGRTRGSTPRPRKRRSRTQMRPPGGIKKRRGPETRGPARGRAPRSRSEWEPPQGR